MRDIDIRKKPSNYWQWLFAGGCVGLAVAAYFTLTYFPQSTPPVPPKPVDVAVARVDQKVPPVPPVEKKDNPPPVAPGPVAPGFVAPGFIMPKDALQIEREMAEMTRGLQGALKQQREKVMAQIAEINARKGGGRASKSRLGLSLAAPNKLLSDQLRIPPGHGLVVNGVTKGSPADLSGLKTHDVILEVDGAMIRSNASQFNKTLEAKPSGSVAKLVVIRAGADTKLDFTIP